MTLDFLRFRVEHYDEYAAWFADLELDSHLGPMDSDWLDAVLPLAEPEGTVWGVYRADELVAVVGTLFEGQRPARAYITEIATKPALRRQGIAAAVLDELFARHARRGFTEHVCYISVRNAMGEGLVARLGFTPVDEPNEHGYVTWQR